MCSVLFFFLPSWHRCYNLSSSDHLFIFPQIILLTYIYLPSSDSDRDQLAKSNGKFAKYLDKILGVYFDYHHDAYSTKGLSIPRIAFLVYYLVHAHCSDLTGTGTPHRCLPSWSNCPACCCWSLANHLYRRCGSCPDNWHHKGPDSIL